MNYNGQKALEVHTRLVQNGVDEHGPDCGDIAAKWAHSGRLNGVFGKWQVLEPLSLLFDLPFGHEPLSFAALLTNQIRRVFRNSVELSSIGVNGVKPAILCELD